MTSKNLLQMVEEYYQERSDNRGRKYLMEFLQFMENNNIPHNEFSKNLRRYRSQIGRQYTMKSRNNYYWIAKGFLEFMETKENLHPESSPTTIIEKQPSSKKEVNTRGIVIHDTFHELQETTPHKIYQW